MHTINERINQIRQRITTAANRVNRSSNDITLVAVTKTHPPDVVAEAIAAGACDLGENRLQEATAKIEALQTWRNQVRWHLIGHLQRNKARTAAELFDLLHAVDSLRLAQALDRHAAPRGRLPILLQFNVSGETSKEGFALSGGKANQSALDQLLPDLEALLALPHLEVRGLMTIAPLVPDPEQARPVFHHLRELRDELTRRYPATSWHELSMGMTDDFEVAIEEGATIIRVGRAIFGERPQR